MSAHCGNCRFWSEMIAQCGDSREIEAMCLADGGPRQGQYTRERDRCPGWKIGDLGAVDNPPNYGEAVRAEYVEREGADALKAAGAAQGAPA